MAEPRDLFALEQLYDAVRARFVDEGTIADQPFGRRERVKQMGDVPRITWAYGDPNGNMGKPEGARRPGWDSTTPARPLALIHELFTCVITGRAPPQAQGDPGFERAQYVATRQLYDAWYRAVYLAAFGEFEIISCKWLVKRNESQADAAIEVVGAIQAAIPDAEVPQTGTDTEANVNVMGSDMTTILETEHAPEAS